MVPVEVILIPENDEPLAPPVNKILLVPVADPIVLPEMLPILALVDEAQTIPVQLEDPVLAYKKFLMVFPWILFAVPVVVER